MSIFIGLGTNLPLEDQRQGPEVLTDALAMLGEQGLEIVQVSAFYRSAPVPISDQDWYINAAAQIATSREPEAVLAILHEVEAAFGRVRSVRNAARTLDLDLLAYKDLILPETGPAPHVPHPRMAGRAFVLLPLRDLAPDWCHPITGASLSTLIAELPKDQRIERLA